MVAVFSIFATLSLIELKMIGVGLASAVLIDATVVRGILVPAALALLGDRSWYFPRWLEWLPGWRLEPSGPEPLTGAAEPGTSAPAAPPARPVAVRPIAALSRREPEVLLAGERTGSREGAA
jgi:RND superfamily putative drug exporter